MNFIDELSRVLLTTALRAIAYRNLSTSSNERSISYCWFKAINLEFKFGSKWPIRSLSALMWWSDWIWSRRCNTCCVPDRRFISCNKCLGDLLYSFIFWIASSVCHLEGVSTLWIASFVFLAFLFRIIDTSSVIMSQWLSAWSLGKSAPVKIFWSSSCESPRTMARTLPDFSTVNASARFWWKSLGKLVLKAKPKAI